jgi:hypothetical protein
MEKGGVVERTGGSLRFDSHVQLSDLIYPKLSSPYCPPSEPNDVYRHLHCGNPWPPSTAKSMVTYNLGSRHRQYCCLHDTLALMRLIA